MHNPFSLLDVAEVAGVLDRHPSDLRNVPKERFDGDVLRLILRPVIHKHWDLNLV